MDSKKKFNVALFGLLILNSHQSNINIQDEW